MGLIILLYFIASKVHIFSHFDWEVSFHLWHPESMKYGNNNNKINKGQLMFMEHFLRDVSGISH